MKQPCVSRTVENAGGPSLSQCPCCRLRRVSAAGGAPRRGHARRLPAPRAAAERAPRSPAAADAGGGPPPAGPRYTHTHTRAHARTHTYTRTHSTRTGTYHRPSHTLTHTHTHTHTHTRHISRSNESESGACTPRMYTRNRFTAAGKCSTYGGHFHLQNTVHLNWKLKSFFEHNEIQFFFF